jgi:ethanolaminephosphotransferase
LIDGGLAIPFTAHVSPPTVTLPRLKAITTGSIPGFADVMGNLDQSDALSLRSQDSWLGRLHERGGKLVFYGDDTWLRLFASTDTNTSFFTRSEGVNGFMTSVSWERTTDS